MACAASEIVPRPGSLPVKALCLEVCTARDAVLAGFLAVARLASAVDRAIVIPFVRPVPAHVSSSEVFAVFPLIALLLLQLMSDASIVFGKQTFAFSADTLEEALFASRSCSSFSARLAAALRKRLRINAFGVPPSQAPVDSSLG